MRSNLNKGEIVKIKNLQDADIFKAKLYNKAATPEGKKDFIRRWQLLKESCDWTA